MRYLVALVIGIVALFVVNVFADLFSMPRPWGSLLMGGVVGITMVIVLLIWEVVRPSHPDEAVKPKLSDEERAQARAERRARLAAEAGVNFDGDDDAAEKSEDLDGTGGEGDARAEDGSRGEAEGRGEADGDAARGRESSAAGSATGETAESGSSGNARKPGSTTTHTDAARTPAVETAAADAAAMEGAMPNYDHDTAASRVDRSQNDDVGERGGDEDDHADRVDAAADADARRAEAGEFTSAEVRDRRAGDRGAVDRTAGGTDAVDRERTDRTAGDRTEAERTADNRNAGDRGEIGTDAASREPADRVVDDVARDGRDSRPSEDSEVNDESHDDSAQGSSLESPPVGQPGVSVDSLDDERDTDSDDGTPRTEH